VAWGWEDEKNEEMEGQEKPKGKRPERRTKRCNRKKRTGGLDTKAGDGQAAGSHLWPD